MCSSIRVGEVDWKGGSHADACAAACRQEEEGKGRRLFW